MLATENRHENAAIWHHARGTVLRQPPQGSRSRRVRSAFMLGGRDPAPRGSALWPRCAHAHGRVGRARRSGHCEIAADERPTPRRNSSAPGLIRRCSASTRSTRSSRHGARGSARSRRRQLPSCGRGSASLRQRARRGRGVLQDEPAQPGPRAPRHVRAGQRRSGRRRARSASRSAQGLSQLDDLSRVADQSRQIVAATAAAHRRLLRSQHLLAVEERRLDRSLAAARQAEREARERRQRPGPRTSPRCGRRSGCSAEQVRSVEVAGTGRPAEVADAAAADDFGRRRASGSSP